MHRPIVNAAGNVEIRPRGINLSEVLASKRLFFHMARVLPERLNRKEYVETGTVMSVGMSPMTKDAPNCCHPKWIHQVHRQLGAPIPPSLICWAIDSGTSVDATCPQSLSPCLENIKMAEGK